MTNANNSIAPWFQEILVCPICKSIVELNGKILTCINSDCSSEFPVIDGIPVMLPQLDSHHSYEKCYFDQEFSNYERYNLENWRKSYLKRIFGSLSIGCSSTDYYLDIGVGGSGYTVIEAARRGNRSVGIDVSIEGIKKARYFARLELGKKSELCGFAVSLAENLPFKDESFSKLSSIAVLEHIPNDLKSISEIARVTKLYGQVFILVPNAFNRIPPIFWLPYYFWDKKVGHLRHYKCENLLDEFSKKCLMPKAVFYNGHFPKLLQNLVCRFHNLDSENSKVWWKLEELDLKNNSPTGLNLILLMGKVR